MRNRLAALLFLPLLLTGCTSTVTNLTPRQQGRTEAGLYPIEIIWETRQKSVKHETVKPAVQIGLNFYPMKRTPMLTNRWETLIPVPTGTNFINYRVRVDYDYDAIPVARPDSRLSPLYQLQVVDQ